MKKVKFVSGFNAKVALAACAVAGFSLIGCDEEDFSVDVPNIDASTTNPDVNISVGRDTIIIGSDTIIINNEYPTEDGAAYLVLSTTATTGEVVSDVTYSILDSEGNVLTDSEGTAYEFPEATTLTVRVPTDAQYTVVAAKTGYYTNNQFVNVPTVPVNQILTVPVNIVLEAIEVDDDEVTADVDTSESTEGEASATTQTVSAPNGTFEVGETYTAAVSVPDATPYLDAAQKEALYAAIDALEGPVTRAAGDDLTVAKDLLRAKVNAYRSSASMNGLVTVSFTVSEAASSVRMIITTVNRIVKITFSVWVNSQEYAVDGECTVPGESTVDAEADGVDISHAHDHGDNANAGGGVFD